MQLIARCKRPPHIPAIATSDNITSILEPVYTQQKVDSTLYLFWVAMTSGNIQTNACVRKPTCVYVCVSA